MSTFAATALPLLHLAAFSSYMLWLSYQNITRLQQYEKQTEKAAQWSNTAARRLHKTRTTQAVGTIAIALSLLNSLAFVVVPSLHTYSNSHLRSSPTLILIGILTLARKYMAGFWNDSKQVEVPFVEKFNEAIRGSKRVVDLLTLLVSSWVLAEVVWRMGLSGLWANVMYFGIIGAFWGVTSGEI